MPATSPNNKRSNRRGTRLLFLLLVALGSATATAQANNWLFNQFGSAAHMHTRTQPGIARFDESVADMTTRWGLALGEWSQRTILDMGKTDNHAVARIHAIDQWVNGVTWAGVATNGDDGDFDHDGWELVNTTDGAGHYNHSHIILNVRDMSPFAFRVDNEAWRQTLACHEIGHAVARGHGGPGCMIEGQVSPHPSQHDIDDTNWFFQNFGH